MYTMNNIGILIILIFTQLYSRINIMYLYIGVLKNIVILVNLTAILNI